MNGCVGLKPTAGRITTVGHLPDVPAFFDGWNTAGPLARRVEDLALALGVLSETPVRPVESLSLKGRRLIVYPRAPILPIHPRVADTVAMAAGALAAAGMAVSRAPRPPLLEAGFSYLALLEREGGGQAFTAALGGGQPYRLWDEIRANVQGRGRISGAALAHNTLTRAMGAALSAVGFGSPARLERLRAAFRAALGEGGLLLCPLLPTPPTWHGWTYWYGLLPPYTFMFNALGVPAVVLPVGWTANGLPLAVQIVAQAGEDEVALAAAAELERVFGGWRLAG
jgi:Asp-tRNA(Asn)/Glu-tRNA(Gln) amidotransferase A subunit family amidase